MPVSGQSLLDSVLHLPLVLPLVVVGLPLVSMGRRGLLASGCGRLVRSLAVCFCWRGAVLAAAVMSFPLMQGPFGCWRWSGGVIMACRQNACRRAGAFSD